MRKESPIEKIALERVYRLFELAEQEFEKHPGRSNRYVEIALAVQKRNKCVMPRELKPKYCKKCKSFLVKGKNAEEKIEGMLRKIKCANCGTVKALGK